MLGVLSFLRFVMAAVSPLIAGYLYQQWSMKAKLIFVALLFAVSAAIFAGADLARSSGPQISPLSPQSKLE